MVSWRWSLRGVAPEGVSADRLAAPGAERVKEAAEAEEPFDKVVGSAMFWTERKHWEERNAQQLT